MFRSIIMKFTNLLNLSLTLNVLLVSACSLFAMENDENGQHLQLSRKSEKVLNLNENSDKHNPQLVLPQTAKPVNITKTGEFFGLRPQGKVPTLSSARAIPTLTEEMQVIKEMPQSNPVIPFEKAFEWSAIGLRSYAFNIQDVEAADKEFLDQTAHPSRLLSMAEMYTIIAMALRDDEVRHYSSHEMSDFASSSIALFLMEKGAPEAATFKVENEKRHAVRRGLLSENIPVKTVEDLIQLPLLKKYILQKRDEILDLYNQKSPKSQKEERFWFSNFRFWK